MSDKENGGYLGNPLLKKPGEKIEWTFDLMMEYQKCVKDPIYFAEKYIQIVHVDKGLIPIRLYDYQKEIINSICGSHKDKVTIILYTFSNLLIHSY